MDLLNKVMVVGNLTRDPEVRKTGNGKAVAEMGLAIRQTGGRREEADSGPRPDPVFLEVVLWERLAETAGQYLKKGSPVLIEGHFRMDSWQDRETGQQRRKLKVVGDRLQFLNFAPPEGRGEERPAEHGRPQRSRQPASRSR